MKLLLDTHAFLWFITGSVQLSPAARAAIEDPANATFISAASAWEIAVKASLGKLKLAEPFDILVPREIRDNGFTYLGIELTHLAQVYALPFHHRDPFDRMLVAQAVAEGMQLVSADPAVKSYGVPIVW
jgi:PIN domain nuclease of toxin-antitoxin system